MIKSKQEQREQNHNEANTLRMLFATVARNFESRKCIHCNHRVEMAGYFKRHGVNCKNMEDQI